MVMATVGAAYGLGTPSATLTNNNDKDALLFGWINQFLALIAIGLGKVALVAFIDHLQKHEAKAKRAFLWFIAGSNFIVNMIAAILVFVQCSPAKKLWDERIPGRCPGRKRVQTFGYIQGPYSAFCDFALAVYPVLIFRKVQAFSLPTKIGLSVLMGLGVVAGACTIVKTVKLKLLTKLEDTTCTYSRETLTIVAEQLILTVTLGTLAELILWNQTEMWVVFIVSCMPPTTAFFRFAYRESASRVSSILHRIRSGDEV
ncbi:hypothetical protein AFGD_004434 [Aspergillus flavus]|nr:hypothetical protein AFGD_004434 [Aspergillus flavus]